MAKFSHAQNVMESQVATVTSGRHWFNATSRTVEEFVPGLLEKQNYEDLILTAVTWIESTDSLSLILYFVLVFILPAWLAAGITLGFYFFWYYYKSAFVNISTTPLLKILNHDAFLLVSAAVVLSLLGIYDHYFALLIGILFFFLFKVGLLRLVMERLNKRPGEGMSLNDRVLKMVLLRYSIYEDVIPPEISNLEDHLKEAFLKVKAKK